MPVYFIQAGEGGAIKIGYAKDVYKRLCTLQTSAPQQLKILGIAVGGRDSEKRLHSKYSASHLNGEWFSCSPLLLKEARGNPSLTGPTKVRRRILTCFEGRNQHIIELREQPRALTLQGIGETVGLSRERVRQILIKNDRADLCRVREKFTAAPPKKSDLCVQPTDGGPHDKLIDALGGYKWLASQLNLKPNRVRMWRVRGVSWEYRPTVARLATNQLIELPKDFMKPRAA